MRFPGGWLDKILEKPRAGLLDAMLMALATALLTCVPSARKATTADTMTSLRAE
jgi:hypothetical protein